MNRVAGTTLRSCAPLAAAAAAAVAVTALPAQAITTWNWSFITDIPDQFASGTFTTADVTPEANVTYTITGISGIYNRGGIAYDITGPDSSFAPYVFQWDGTQNSPIISNLNGIRFDTSPGGDDFTVQNDLVPGFAAIRNQFSTFPGNDGAITSSSLAPSSPAPADVPGPLPLMGAGAAFAWSRRLRKRVATRPAFKF